MLYQARKGQTSYGEAIGILMMETFDAFIPGDVGNATTYSYPVRYKTVKGFTFERLYKQDKTLLEPLLEAGRELVQEGVRAITGDCGYMALFQNEMAAALDVPVFLSSLLQVPFIAKIIGHNHKVGIICADSRTLDTRLLQAAGIDNSHPIHIKGMQNRKHFSEAALLETGVLDSDGIEAEVIATARELVAEDPRVKALLLECSMLPPYGAAVHEAVNLPVFDYITMIDYVFSAVVKKRYTGFM